MVNKFISNTWHITFLQICHSCFMFKYYLSVIRYFNIIHHVKHLKKKIKINASFFVNIISTQIRIETSHVASVQINAKHPNLYSTTCVIRKSGFFLLFSTSKGWQGYGCVCKKNIHTYRHIWMIMLSNTNRYPFMILKRGKSKIFQKSLF